jgi:lysophospholipase L1-like esterase
VVCRRKVYAHILAMFASALTILTTVSGSSAASATTTSGFYLDLGASVSVGIQPTAFHPSGFRTRQGFSNDLIAYEASRGISLSLTELGCPGETVTTMVNGQDGCYHAGDSQLADAITFLNAHHGQTGLVTIDLGFNNVVPCLQTAIVDPNCLQQSLAQVGPQLTSILTVLKAAAGPHVTFVGLSFADPYVAKAASGISGRVHARASLQAISQLDQTLAMIYQSQGIPMANVARVFHLHQTSPITGGSITRVPTSVATVCHLTWMCAAAPYGPNIHPNAAGYEAISDAVIAVLPPPFR